MTPRLDERAVLAEIFDSGTEQADPRVRYVTIQVDRRTWASLVHFRDDGAPTPTPLESLCSADGAVGTHAGRDELALPVSHSDLHFGGPALCRPRSHSLTDRPEHRHPLPRNVHGFRTWG